MAKINVLPGEVSELIAAGEVIERPASIAKELVENSIDAGASTITVEIQGGGVQYLRITDNGWGMEPEDAPTAFLRHATSKVRTAEDLDSIHTLGFRGEALASIAAIAHVELLTRTPEAEIGTLVKVSASQVESVEEAGCPVGTTVVVRDVFYNVPARLKFLKKDTAEANAVESILEKIAFSHPEISLKFLRENRTVFHTPGDGRLLSAVYTLFGREFSQSLLPVEYELGGVRVTGYTGKPVYTRANRSMQHFFVNGRYTKTRTGGAALEEAYRSSMMVGKFPVCVLQIELPCPLVDVNVHPSKIEVRFVSEKSVFDAVYFAIKTALARNNEIAPQAAAPKRQPENLLSQFTEQQGEQQTFPAAQPQGGCSPEPGSILQPAPALKPISDSAEGEGKGRPEEKAAAPLRLLSQEEQRRFREPMVVADGGADYQAVWQERSVLERNAPSSLLSKADSSEEAHSGEVFAEGGPLPGTSPLPERPLPERQCRIRVVGEIFSTYILTQVDDTFALIDKHAAHERILYNRLKASQEGLEKQYLLSAMPVTLSRTEHGLVLERQETLERLGFMTEDFGGSTVLLRSIPAVVAGVGPKEIFLEILAAMAEMKRQELPEVVEEILHRIACHSAVRGGDINAAQELQRLAELVCNDPEVRYCPHGRPVIIQYTRTELERMFGRIM